MPPEDSIAAGCGEGFPAAGAVPAEDIVPDIDVIVVTYNSSRELDSNLTGVRRAAAGGRVVVVDNASSDGSADVARDREADVVIANDRNLGFARAVNLGLAACSSEHVLLLNPDAELGQAALASMRAVLRKQTGAAIVAPLLRDPEGVTESGAGRFATLTRRVGLCLPLVGRAPNFRPQYRLLPDVRAAGRALDVDYVFGAAMLADRAFLVAAGGLDERFFLFAEDEDICRQARAAGRRVLLDTRAVARHIGGASYADETRTEAQRLYSTYLLFGKWRGQLAAAAYHAGIVRASWMRAQAARAERRPQAAATIGRMNHLFDAAVRSGIDPLVSTPDGTAPEAESPHGGRAS